jgi:hypothetical protein
MDLFSTAIQADKDGTLAEWVQDYLRLSGDNDVLAADLLREATCNSGLINYPLDQLRKLLGPSESFDYPEDPSIYEQRVTSMMESLKNGWKPAPFIASKIWADDFELHDGAHRAEAMRRLGIKEYPTVFFFKNDKQRKSFIDQITSHLPR